MQQCLKKRNATEEQTFLTICSEVVTAILVARSMAGANISCMARSTACLTQLFR